MPDYTAGQQQTFVAPRTEWEQRLADIFKDELHVPSVGAHDNFFDIGGSSLRVISVLQRLQTGFGVQLAPETVYAAPTVAELAKVDLSFKRGSCSTINSLFSLLFLVIRLPSAR